VQAERAGIRRINQAGGVAGAHLANSTRISIRQRLPAQEPVHVVVGLSQRGDDMKSLLGLR